MPSIALTMSLRGQLLSSTKVAPFSPTSLFAANEAGVWYDPSDLTTLFQDTAGTTPVTTPGQTVALALDKSRGLVLGSELVDTANSSSTWIAFGTNTIAQDGDAVRVTFVDNQGGAYAPLNQSGGTTINLTSGSFYRLTGQARINTGSANVRIGGNLSPGNTDILAVSSTSYVDFSAVFQCTGVVPNIQFSGLGSGEIIWIRNISVRELPGNHATQSTAASRPIYAVVPSTGRRNLLTYTEQFDNAAWIKGRVADAIGPTVSANTVVAPDGTTTGDTVTINLGGQFVRQDVPFASGASGTITVWAYAPLSGGATSIRITTNNASTWSTGISQSFALTSGWNRLSLSGTLISSGSTCRVLIGAANADGTADATITGTFYLWGAQLETGSTATAYQRVVSAFDVTEAGVQSLSYLSFDGVDDFLVTPTITPGIDKAQVFAGVRKLSDAATGLLAEFSPGSGQGRFEVFAPLGAASPNYFWNSGGSIFRSVTATTFSAPTTNVLTGTGDISGDNSTLRINGAQVGQSLLDQGIGNYLAYPLYIGRRAGTSNPFNGRIYSLIVRFGANLTNTQITNTETWVNSKTGAY